MINDTFIYARACGRVLLALSVLALGTSLSACLHSEQNAKVSATAKQTKTASAKQRTKTAKAVPRVATTARAQAADPVTTASIAPEGAPIAGRTWNYEYAGSRGTITYNLDGTSSYNEPGLRKGSGKWRIQDGALCQSFSGIKEPCVNLRQSGKAIYVGDMKLTRVE
jgi:hypothetical protein